MVLPITTPVLFDRNNVTDVEYDARFYMLQ